MLRFSANDLTTLFGLIEMEEDLQSFVSDLLATDPQDVFKPLVKLSEPLEAIYLYFKNIKLDIKNQNNKTEFVNFIVACSKLCLLIYASDSHFKENPNLVNNYVMHLDKLTNVFMGFFKKIDLDPQLYLLNRLNAFASQSPLLLQAVRKATNDLILMSNKSLDLNTIDESSSAHVHYMRLIKLNDDYLNDFIVNIRRNYSEQPNYRRRNSIMTKVLESLELIKDKLSLQDIEWLIDRINSLAAEYARENSCFNASMNNARGFVRMNTTNWGMFLNTIILGILSAQAIAAKYVVTSRIGAIDQVQNLHRNEEVIGRYPAEARDVLLAGKNTLVTLYNLDVNNLPAHRESAESYLTWVPLIYIALLTIYTASNYVFYRHTSFYSAHVLPAPVSLPSWCNDVKAELDKKQDEQVVKSLTPPGKSS